MKPSEQCKKAGLDSLKELSELCNRNAQTLINLSKSNPTFFEVLVMGGVWKKRELEKSATFEVSEYEACVSAKISLNEIIQNAVEFNNDDDDDDVKKLARSLRAIADSISPHEQ